MSCLRDVILIVDDRLCENDQSTRLLEIVSDRYDIFRIDDMVLQRLQEGKVPLDVLGSSLCDFVQAHCFCDEYRVLVGFDAFPAGYSLIKHLLGRDLRVSFVGAFGEGDWRPLAKQAHEFLRLPIHYIADLGQTFNLPDSWSICDISQADRTQACAKLYQTIDSSSGAPVPELTYRPLFAIQSSSSKNAPVFCIPGAGDNIASFTGVCAALGTEHAVYGMQPRGLDGQMLPHYSVGAAARSYIEAIKTVRTQGPVHLIGHSFGGWIAYEMAAILADRAKHDLPLEVESVTIIDSEAPGGKRAAAELSDLYIIKSYIESVELVCEKRLSIQLQDWLEICAQERMQRLHHAMVSGGILPARSKADILRGPYNTFAAAIRTHYSPRQLYEGELRLVLAPDPKLTAQENADEQRHISSAWQEYAHSLQVFRGEGNHISILSPPHVNAMIGWWKSRNIDEKAKRLSMQPLKVRTFEERERVGNLALISTIR